MNKKFYFTFGSSASFPFQNGYIIVISNSLESAICLFRAFFPDRHRNIVNCSDFYPEDEWNERVSKFYEGRKPFAVISAEMKTIE